MDSLHKGMDLSKIRFFFDTEFEVVFLSSDQIRPESEPLELDILWSKSDRWGAVQQEDEHPLS